MKLREIIEHLKLNNIPTIQFYGNFKGEAEWYGSAYYENGELKYLKPYYDDYSLDDEFDSFDFARSYEDGSFILCVYEHNTEWINMDGTTDPPFPLEKSLGEYTDLVPKYPL